MSYCGSCCCFLLWQEWGDSPSEFSHRPHASAERCTCSSCWSCHFAILEGVCSHLLFFLLFLHAMLYSINWWLGRSISNHHLFFSISISAVFCLSCVCVVRFSWVWGRWMCCLSPTERIYFSAVELGPGVACRAVHHWRWPGKVTQAMREQILLTPQLWEKGS